MLPVQHAAAPPPAPACAWRLATCRPGAGAGLPPCAVAARKRKLPPDGQEWKAQLAERYPELGLLEHKQEEGQQQQPQQQQPPPEPSLPADVGALERQLRQAAGARQHQDLLSLGDSGWSVEAADLGSEPGAAAAQEEEEGGWPLGGSGAATSSRGRRSRGAFAQEEEEEGSAEEEEDGADEEELQRAAALRALRDVPGTSLAELQAAQSAGDAANKAATPAERRKARALRKTHTRLRIVHGRFAKRRLLSGMGPNTRPMMEVVRGAVFSMLGAALGTGSALPPGTRWLDLYAGTGAVGLEGLSRGAAEATFVETDSWTINNVLQRNLQRCGVADVGRVVSVRAETFLERAQRGDGREAEECPPAAAPFDFISVCPPYEAVSYPEVFGLLEGSPLLGERTLVVVEYPQASAAEVPPRLGPLTQLRNRRFGRTYVALYGGSGSDGVAGPVASRTKDDGGVVVF